jgi:hypothetical protein
MLGIYSQHLEGILPLPMEAKGLILIIEACKVDDEGYLSI